MEYRQCKACRQPFRPRPQNPDQCFCSAAACQRERRRRWQAAKRQNDPDYRDNQKRAQKAWAERHSDYWRTYRDQHPEYVARNRARQRERALGRAGVAKMDASKTEIALPSGTYRLSPMIDASLAKMDAWTVEITVLSATCRAP
ncbi:hypothetical protein [Candidatus Accumulibacter sp. ACC012]|jgi:hypothetical protein|uniref:hypothetical protein n=1 Tax=Candidatus Accumulibacter sp. ACC012 TaxID=2823332 RepID=UPI0025B8FCC2|nr:hypothetical protein [Candidatus Accumulibacter sp. ACC012]